MNFVEFLNVNAQKYPLKPAIGFRKNNGWKEINWQTFRTVVFKTANALKNLGIEPGDKVAIYADNSAEWITFDLAIIALGAISVPIYSTNNTEQTEYIINHAECKAILAGNQQQYDAALEISARSLFLKHVIAAKKKIFIKKEISVFFEDFIEKQSNQFEIFPKNESDLATVIYTSGTTGIPKGVMLTQGNFIKCFDAHFDFFKFKNFENEHSLAFLPLSHVFERSWTLLCLNAGAKVSFLDDTKLIAAALPQVKPTTMCAVPRFWQKIYAGILENVKNSSSSKQKIFDWAIKIGYEAAELRRTNQPVPFGLKTKLSFADVLVFSKIKNKLGGKLWFMPCGGASISPEVTKFFDAMGLHLTVGYGLTETTATLTAFPFTNYVHGSAGTTFGSTQIKIGENDEILAKGDGIMTGYYKNPEETAKVFTEDGWFKTGDAGKFDEKGNLFITDRIKDLMKTSNGKYIAPQMIENQLSNNNYIQQIMVVAEGRPFVAAVVVPNFEVLKEELKNLKIDFTNWNEIVNNPKVNEFYKEKIEQFQQNLNGFEKVKKFTLLPAEFEISSGEITPTLKIKRNIVLEKYKDLIEKMY